MIGGNSFDIVLDMLFNGLMSEEVFVFGYFLVGCGYLKLVDVLEEILILMGIFDKFKYFCLDFDLCVYSLCGVKGCECCVDVCFVGVLFSEGLE